MRITFLSLILISGQAHAILDTNWNGLSDFWEIAQFDRLLPEETDLTTDEDGDGWDLREEAAAGTSPFNAQPPLGFVTTALSRIPGISEDANEDGIPEVIEPESVALTWSGIAGKNYSIITSPDLTPDSWSLAASSIGGISGEMRRVVPLPEVDGSYPTSMFFQLLIDDMDSDRDGLTDAEEIAFGSDPHATYSDGDDLNDEQEAIHGMDPKSPDSDGNGTPDHLEPKVAGFVNKNVGYAPTYSWIYSSRTLGFSFVSHGEPDAFHGGTVSASASWDSRLNYYGQLTESIPIDRLRQYLADNIHFPATMPPGSTSYLRDVWSNVYYSEPDDPHRTESGTITEMQMRLASSHGTDHEIRRSFLLVKAPQVANQEPTLEAFTAVIPQGLLSSPPDIIGDEIPIVSGQPHKTSLYEAEFKIRGEFSTADGWDDTEADLTRSVKLGSKISASLDCDAPLGVKRQLEIVPTSGDEPGIGITGLEWESGGASFEIEGRMEGTYKVVFRMKSNPSVIFASMTVHVFKRVLLPIAIFRVWDSRNPKTAFDPNSTHPQIEKVFYEYNDTFKYQAMIEFTKDYRSRDIDLAKEPGAPVWFDESGAFNFDNRKGDADSYLTSITEKHLIFVIIVNRLDQKSKPDLAKPLGLTDSLLHFTAVDSQSDVRVYAHEMGHALGITEKGGFSNHDNGPFPSWWKDKRYVGLMIEYVGDNQTRWIRSTDWIQANKIATKLNAEFYDSK